MSQPTEREAAGVTIARWLSFAHRDRLMPGLDKVFYESSATQTFASDEVRRAFRERWLGRYLERYPEWVYVACEPSGAIVGYIVASTDDPARTALFSDIGYFQDFSAVTVRYPAQLHVNLAPDRRGHGIGARLVQTLADDLARAGVPGVHVVTTRGMRNVRYYEANDFREVGSTNWKGRELVMLGRELSEQT